MELSTPKLVRPPIYDQLLESEEELTNYLKYLRYKQPIPKVVLPSPPPKEIIRTYNYIRSKTPKQPRKQSREVKPLVRKYFSLLGQVGQLENSISKKIIKKTLQFLQQFPTLYFLTEIVNSFGRQKRRLCLNEVLVLKEVNDEMVPLFEKITEKIQGLKKESESKKLMELGHRIQHLQALIDLNKDKVTKSEENQLIFRSLQGDRVEKYLLMEENISKAQKNYGFFSPNFIKNREVFSNINNVYLQIRRSTLSD